MEKIVSVQSELRFLANLLPKASAEQDAQSKLIPNGNQVISLASQRKQAEAPRRVNQIESSAVVSLDWWRKK